MVLLRHARETYERSTMYGATAHVNTHGVGSISIETDQANIDIELKDGALNSLQDAENSSKIEVPENKDR